ncbi:MAG: TonB-dependent receptor [Filimonas sp.]|nr:TonB-dependent receptor [Filimonas sp.]
MYRKAMYHGKRLLMKYSAKFFLCMCICLLLTGGLFAQPFLLKGQVLDENAATLAGVTVAVKQTGKTLATDASGRFTMSANKGDVLVITFVGYQKQELTVANNKELAIVLQPEHNSLNDVVVVGYGTVRRKDLTGAVGQVNMEDLNKAPVKSFDEALAGRVAGVMVSSTEGQPGSAINIVIRGNNSITQSNSPLYVIDGFPIENPDNNILNPQDIESIDILKDASATAIYGARGANGVVIITTKRGKVGKPVISYNGYYAQQKITKTIPVMNAYQFVKLQKEMGVDLSQTYLANGVTVDDYKNVETIDWQDRLYRTAPMQSHNLSLTGGTQQTRYAISGQLFDQQGVIINSGFKRYQGKASLDQVVNNKLKVGVNMLYTATQTYGTQPSNQSGQSMNNMMYSTWGFRPAAPINPAIDVQPDYTDDLIDDMVNPGTDYRMNPVLLAENEYRKRFVNSLIANAYIDYSITKDLKLRITGGLNKLNQRNEAFNNSKTRSGNPNTIYGVNGSINYYETNNWLNENTLTYTKRFNRDHNFSVLGGLTMQGNNYQYSGQSANQLQYESLGLNGLQFGVPQPITSGTSEWTAVSWLSRVNYSYKEKYLLTASFRADGSSKFKKENQWGYFPSASAAWRIKQEAFLKHVSFISDAKIRAGYGVTGNNRVSEYATYATMSFPVGSYYSYGNALQNGAIPASLASEDLKWESTAQSNVGIDMGFLKDRISITIDYYKKITSNLLLNADLPPTSGYGKAYKNIGKTSNEGIEFTLNTTNISNKNFMWTSSFNISFNRNKVLALTQNQDAFTSSLPWDGTPGYSDVFYLAKVGQPLGQFYGYIWQGVYQYEDFDKLPNGKYLLKDNIPTNGNTRAAIQPGDIKYKDINGDGIVDGNDRTIIGRGLPVHIGGFSNNFKYKNFSLNIFFQWSYGNQIMNANRYKFEDGSKSLLNQYASFEDRWTPTHTKTTMPRAGGQYANMYSDRVLEDGSYLRLKTVQLSYALPEKLIKKAGLKSCSFYTSAQNLVTWTKYSGYDPEVSVNYSALTPGLDYSPYPRARTITLGANISF